MTPVTVVIQCYVSLHIVNMKTPPVLSLINFLHPQQWQIVQQAATIAAEFNLRLFAVGGIVRDALLADAELSQNPRIPITKNKLITDIDLVVDGAPKAGIMVATALQKYYRQAKLQTHDQFQTAELHFAASSLDNLDNSDTSNPIDWNFTIDLATARQEVYAYEGANPEVQNTTIDQDLYRRDFTINALAIQVLPSGIPTEIIDQFHGLTDLKQGLLRPIRTGSFAEDPRRIYRAVRFAVRLNLALVPSMELEIKNTINTGHFDNLGGSRLRAEIIYNLQERPIIKSSQIWQRLHDLDALRCIHSNLKLPDKFTKDLRLLDWLTKQITQIYASRQSVKSKFKHPNYNFAELGLTLICSYLSDADLEELNLPLNNEQQAISKTMQKYQVIVANLENYLITHNLQDFHYIKPSFIYEQFCHCHEWELIIWFCRGSKPMRQLIWCYLSRWQFVQSPFNGKDLQQLGYPSGKILGRILAELRNLCLDQVIDSPQSAREWLAQNRPIIV